MLADCFVVLLNLLSLYCLQFVLDGVASSITVSCGLAILFVVKLASLLAADCFVGFSVAFLSLMILQNLKSTC